MTKATARAVRTNGVTTMKIGDKECTARAMGLAELEEVERLCVEDFKRDYLKTWTDNQDLLPDDKAAELVTEEFRKVARWTIHDLPVRMAHDSSSIDVTDELREHINAIYPLKPVDKQKWDDRRIQRLVAVALDRGQMSEDQCKALTGSVPVKAMIEYPSWWITGCFRGMVAFAWVAFRKQGVTKEEVAEAMNSNPRLFTDLTKETESLSRPEVGNG
jgi:actin-related protein